MGLGKALISNYLSNDLIAKALITYLLITFGLAYLLDLPLITGLLPLSYFNVLAAIRMWVPFLGAITALRLCRVPLREGVRGLGFSLGRIKYLPLGLVIPYLIYGLGVGVCYLEGLKPHNPLIVMTKELSTNPLSSALIRSSSTVFLILQLLASAINGLTIGTALAIGEESGWRGLMYVILYPKYGLLPSAIFTGAAWSLWHAPLIVFLKYSFPHHPDVVGVSMYSLVLTTWSVIMYVLRCRSESLIPPAVMHGTLNSLGALMLFTYSGTDELYTIPVGTASLVASLIIAITLVVTLGRGTTHS